MPNPNSSEAATAKLSSIGTAPTLTVIVVDVTAVILRADPDAGSVLRGYVLVEVLPSCAQVNPILLSAIRTVLLVVKE